MIGAARVGIDSNVMFGKLFAIGGVSLLALTY